MYIGPVFLYINVKCTQVKGVPVVLFTCTNNSFSFAWHVTWLDFMTNDNYCPCYMIFYSIVISKFHCFHFSCCTPSCLLFLKHFVIDDFDNCLSNKHCYLIVLFWKCSPEVILWSWCCGSWVCFRLVSVHRPPVVAMRNCTTTFKSAVNSFNVSIK